MWILSIGFMNLNCRVIYGVVVIHAVSNSLGVMHEHHNVFVPFVLLAPRHKTRSLRRTFVAPPYNSLEEWGEARGHKFEAPEDNSLHATST